MRIVTVEGRVSLFQWGTPAPTGVTVRTSRGVPLRIALAQRFDDLHPSSLHIGQALTAREDGFDGVIEHQMGHRLCADVAKIFPLPVTILYFTQIIDFLNISV